MNMIKKYPKKYTYLEKKNKIIDNLRLKEQYNKRISKNQFYR